MYEDYEIKKRTEGDLYVDLSFISE